MRLLAAVLSGLVLASLVLAREPGLGEYRAVQESLSRVHPRMRARWLKEHGLDDSYYTTFHKPESTSGLSCVGRWPWGPSWELAGRDTFLYLGSGSGVRILSIADSVQPRMLGQVNARGLVSQVVVQDSLLFVACGSWGAQIHSVSDPANPRELGSMDAVINDVCVKDTFCYAVGRDSFRIYNTADPSLPILMGSAADSGDAIVFANGHAFVGGAGPLNVYNVSDPYHPTLVNSLGGPTYDMFVRRNLLFCAWKASPTRFSILNVNDPLNIIEVSGLSGYAGDGVYANDSFALVSCIRDHVGLFAFDVSDSSRPSVRDSINPEGVVEWQPYAPCPNSYGYLADDYGGLITIDLHNVNSISEIWSGYKACRSLDIDVDDGRAYVANDESGLQIIDVTDPTRPNSLGIYDLVGAKTTTTVQTRDSFAFTGFWGSNRRFLRVLDVTDPALPVFAGEESCFNPLQDVVLRETLLYAAEPYEFEVFNVARPREPERVGSCVLSGDVWDMDVQDSIAYVTSNVLTMVNITRPDSPRVAAAWSPMVAVNVDDTIAYTIGSGAVWSLGVANPTQPHLLDTVRISGWVSDIVVGDTLAFAGGAQLYIINVADPRNMRVVEQWTPPREFRRLLWTPTYLYAACYEAGVCILETVPTGLEEPQEKGGTQANIRLSPSVTTGPVTIVAGRGFGRLSVRLYNGSGAIVGESAIRGKPGATTVQLDLSGYPDGVYFVNLHGYEKSFTAKVVKINRR